MVVDEVDRVAGEQISPFCLALLNSNPSLCLVIVSRILPIGLLQDVQLRGVVEFVPREDEGALHDYPQTENNLAYLEVMSFGTGRVYLNGRMIVRWDGVLPRLLFFFLVDKGMVRRDEIFETFWPNMSIKEATNVFHVTKRKINEVLGMDLTIYRSGFYCITDKVNLLYDVMQFNRMLQDSEISDPEVLEALLQDTIRLYRGDYLATSDAQWVKHRREEMRQAYGGALYALALLNREKGDAELANTYFLRAYRHNPNEQRYAEAVEGLLKRAK